MFASPSSHPYSEYYNFVSEWHFVDFHFIYLILIQFCIHNRARCSNKYQAKQFRHRKPHYFFHCVFYSVLFSFFLSCILCPMCVTAFDGIKQFLFPVVYIYKYAYIELITINKERTRRKDKSYIIHILGGSSLL